MSVVTRQVGTVSAVNIGQMFRNGWDNSVKDADAMLRQGMPVTVRLAP